MWPVVARSLLGLSVLALGAGLSAAKPPTDRLGVMPTRIHEIQGSGLASPLAGSEVVVEGVVTAETYFGYFIQSPDDGTDGLPETSEALFVQKEGLDARLVNRGDRVVVHGRVVEVLPNDDPHQLTVTQLTDVTGQYVIANGQPLPAPVALDVADLSPDSDPTALARLEGMRVSAAELVVVGAAESWISPASQTVRPGVTFHAVLGRSVANDAPPFREPGLPPLTAEPLPAGKSLPFNGGNPQVLAIDDRSLRGEEFHDLAVGRNDRVRNVVGVLDYWRGYRLLVDRDAPVVAESGHRGEGAAFLAAGEVKLAWMDLGDLYDASDDPARDEPVHSPGVYQARLAKIATGLCTFLANPEVIAVGGVENVQVLEDLAALVDTNPAADCPVPRQYEAVLVEGSDDSGLDLGFLVAGYVVDGVNPRVQVLAAETIAAAETSAHPNGGSERLFTRPPLALTLRVTDEGGRQVELTAVNVRLQEGRGSDSLGYGPFGWSTGGDRIMSLRARQAARIAAWIEERQQADPEEAIAVLGGFEADAFNDGRVDVMGIVTGRTAPANETWLTMPSPITTPLANLTDLAPAHTRYNATDQGELRALDHIVVNDAMRRRFAITSAHPRMNADFPSAARAAGDPGPTFSTRDPLIARLLVPGFFDADTRVQVHASGTRSPRVDNSFYLELANQGPDNAPALELVLESSLAPSQWRLFTDRTGWTCDAIEAYAEGSRVRCTNTVLANNASHSFRLDVPADLALEGSSATFTAQLVGRHNDPNSSNNQSAGTVSFDGLVDVRVELHPVNGNEDMVPGTSSGWIVEVHRTALNPAGLVSIMLDIDAAADSVTIEPIDDGVNCDAGVATGAGSTRFSCTAENNDALRVAGFGILFQTGIQDGGRVISLRAEANSASPDATPADNVATASLRVSDHTDLVVSTVTPSLDVATLDGPVSVYVSVQNALPGAARGGLLEILVDLPPTAVGEAEPQVSGPTPNIWTCLPPQADGEGSRIRCAASWPLYQPEFPSFTYGFRFFITPPYRPGQSDYDVTTRVTVTSDSEEQVPADNTAQASFVVDQTSDIGIGFSAPLVGVAEPGQAIFPVQIEYFGPNLPRNARAHLTFDRELPPADVSITGDYGLPVACALEPTAAGRTLLHCPIASGSEGLRVAVRTNPDLARKGELTLEAAALNDLIDPRPANDSTNGTVGVVGLADLCIGHSCGPLPPSPLPRLEPDRANTLLIPFVNLGPGTARETVVIVQATVAASWLSGTVDGQACEPVYPASKYWPRLRCALDDLPGDGALRWVQVGLDFTGVEPPEVAGSIGVILEIESATWDPAAHPNNVSFNVPYAVIVDLSAKVSAKRSAFPEPANFMVEVAAAGPATTALSELVLRVESPGATGTANLWFDAPGWGCSAEISTNELQQWLCPRYLPLDANSGIRVEVPAHAFAQIGRPIRVTASHRYRPDALGVDRTPDNDTATAVHMVDGRRTQSTGSVAKPTPAYGVKRQPEPSPLRAPARRGQTR